jgi:2-dehydro-3-deoxy-D-arabinonate dehydratase
MLMDQATVSMPGFAAICRFRTPDNQVRLGWWDGHRVADLSATGAEWAASVAAVLAATTPLATLAAGALPGAASHALQDVVLLAPIDAQEVWAAGVTYERSRQAREHESEHAADVYTRVYEAERPELFYKGDMRRTAGPGGQIRVRPDSRWTVPEPELALVLDPLLRIAGFTIGNDVSARDIEGENPLYLPQAKLYDGACALGPWIVPAESIADPYDLENTCTIARDGQTVWEDRTNTGRLHRKLDELTAYLGRGNTFPAGVFLLTGTPLVPPDSLSLQSGDVVEVTIAELGTLRNIVG